MNYLFHVFHKTKTFKKYLFIYLAASGLSCGMRDLCCGMWDLSLWCKGSSLQRTGLSLVVVPWALALWLWRAGSVVAVCGLSSCGVWAQQLQSTGLVAPRHVESQFPDQGLNPCPCIGKWILKHWTTREDPHKTKTFDDIIFLLVVSYQLTNLTYLSLLYLTILGVSKLSCTGLD